MGCHSYSHSLLACDGTQMYTQGGTVSDPTGAFPAVASFPCLECGKTFQHSSSLRMHKKNHHGAERGPFQCEHCSKVLMNRNSLKTHMYNFHSRADKNKQPGPSLSSPSAPSEHPNSRRMLSQIQHMYPMGNSPYL